MRLDKDIYNEAIIIWQKLGNVTVDEKDCIDVPFLHFDVGTDKIEIWQWIEETYDVAIIDLMKLGRGINKICWRCDHYYESPGVCVGRCNVIHGYSIIPSRYHRENFRKRAEVKKKKCANYRKIYQGGIS